MASKRGLGKGLSALITDDLEEEIIKQKNGIIQVGIHKVEPNREQPRKRFDEDALIELSDSIKQHGIIQPLIVADRDSYYEIIAGERRWRAAKIAGLREVPIIIKTYSKEKNLEISLIENLQREDLNPIEEAIAYQKLIEDFSLKQDEVAEKVSKSRSAIANTMRLLKLDQRVQQMIIDEMLTSGHARTLLALEDKEKQYDIACQIFDEKLNVRETEKLIKKLLNSNDSKETNKENEFEPIYIQLEDRIKEILGTKVKIKSKGKKKGKIEIDYYSNEELDRIIELLESIH